MIQSAPLLQLEELRKQLLSTNQVFAATDVPSPKTTPSIPTAPGSYVTVKRAWLQQFLETLPHNPYPGPGDSPPLRKLRPGDPQGDEDIMLLASDMQLAASRLPGHSFARNRLIKQLKGRDTTSSLASVINAAVDSSGFYTGQQVVNMLERQHEEEEGRLRHKDHAEAEAACGRMLLADTLSGRVNAAIIIQRVFRAYSRRKRLSEWFNSDNNSTAFQQSHLSDRVWKTKSKRLAPNAHPFHYAIEEKAEVLPPPEDDEEDVVSQPIPIRAPHSRALRRAFGTTFAARVLDNPDTEGMHIHRGSVSMRQRGSGGGVLQSKEVWTADEDKAGERRLLDSRRLQRLPSWCSEQQQQGEDGRRPGRASYAPSYHEGDDMRPLQGEYSQHSTFTPRTSCTPDTGIAAPSGAATPERSELWGEGSDCGRGGRIEMSPSASSFLPPIQSSCAMDRIMRMRSARASRQACSMSGIEGLGGSKAGSSSSSAQASPTHTPDARPTSEPPSRQSMPGTGSDTPLSPGSKAQGSILDAVAGVQWGPGSEASFLSERSPSRSGGGGWQQQISPSSTPSKRGPDPAQRKGRLSNQGNQGLDAPTSGTAIVMHGTVHNPRKPSRLSCSPALAAAEKELRAAHLGSSPRGAHPPPSQQDSGLNPRALFLKWKEEERKRIELRNANDPNAAQLPDDDQGETFVSYMHRSMQATTGSKSFS